ncbi:MAG: ATP-binding cassette domain-containing protein [Leptolyngbyaceae cyanobacterium SM1_3_5]|nr:ATP-binding cassette domain-containing protein [Leptolyngbyaceae cyanobacterium SM1_3_5]
MDNLDSPTRNSRLNQWQLEQVGLRPPIGSQLLLQSVSAELMGGDRCALIGATGAGKTLLLRLLNRLTDPSEGSILFQGRDLQQIPIAQLRQVVTLVLPEPRLLGMTVRDAIAYPLTFRNLSPTVIQQRVADWIDRLQIPSDWLSKTEVQLTLSQRQWVSIARACACEPAVLLLDEPFTALDGDRRLQLLNLLQDPALRQTTIVIATHQVKLVRSWAQRVWCLHQGKLLWQESSDRLDWEFVQDSIAQAEADVATEWD